MDTLHDPQYRTADGSALRIWRDTDQNKFASQAAGRPVFDEVIYAEVISPGSRDSTPVFELVRTFAAESSTPGQTRYGMKYAEYRQHVEDFIKGEEIDSSLTGTPLKQWAEMTRTMVASLKAQNIYTVDALANLPDTRLHLVGPDGRTWREKARAYIAQAENAATATKLAAELAQRDADLADLREQVRVLSDTIAAQQAELAAQRQVPQPPPAPPPQPEQPPVVQQAEQQATPPKGKGGKAAESII